MEHFDKRRGDVRKALLDNQVRLKSTVTNVEKEQLKNIDVGSFIDRLEELLDSLDIAGENTLDKRLKEKYIQYVQKSVERYVKADIRANKRKLVSSALDGMTAENIDKVLLEYVNEFNKINGLVDSLNAAHKTTVYRSPEEIISIIEDPYIPDEFKTGGILRYALIQNPKDPRSAIERMVENYEELEFDEDIPEEWKTTTVLNTVVRSNPQNPKEAIERMIASYDALIADSDIPEEWKTQTVLMYVVIKSPRNPKEAIKRIIDRYNTLMADPDIPEEWKTEAILKTVIIKHSENPKKAIMDTIKICDDISSDPSIPQEWKVPKILTYVAMANREHAKEKLLEAIWMFRDVMNDDTIPESLRADRSRVMNVVIMNSSLEDIKAALLSSKDYKLFI